MGFIAGGFAKMFINLGASLGLGRVKLTLVQQVPELPGEYFKSARIKRIFFYIEPVKDTKREVGLRPGMPLFETKSLKKRDPTPFDGLFKSEGFVDREEDEEGGGLVKFDKHQRDLYLTNDLYGKIYILNVYGPIKIRKFLLDHPRLKGRFKRVHMLHKSILVELEKGPKAEEDFRDVMEESAQELEHQGVKLIEPCTKQTCLELKVSGVNLVPMIMRDNAIKLDAFIEAGKVPDSFQLKGFIEFELKLKLTF